MVDSDKIMELLESGMSADEIAKEFQESLNAAIYKQKQKSNKEKIRAMKIEDMDKIKELIVFYFYNYYVDFLEDFDFSFLNRPTEDYVDAIDNVVKDFYTLSSMLISAAGDNVTSFADVEDILKVLGVTIEK